MNDMFQQIPSTPEPNPVPGMGTVAVQDTAGSPLPGAAVGIVPETQGVVPEQIPQQMSVTRQLTEPLWRAKSWMKFIGILLIINGVFCILGIWTIIICWLPIWMGLLLVGASNRIRQAAVLDSEMHLKGALDKIGLFCRIWGITALVMLILMVGFMLFMMIAGASMMNSFMSQQGMVY